MGKKKKKNYPLFTVKLLVVSRYFQLEGKKKKKKEAGLQRSTSEEEFPCYSLGVHA